MDTHNWIMDYNYLWMSIIIGFHIVPAIYALGLLDWLIGPGLKQGNVYDNPLPKMNEWMNESMNERIFSSWKDWSDPQQIRLTLALIHTSRSWYHNRRTYVDKIHPREILCKCDRNL